MFDVIRSQTIQPVVAVLMTLHAADRLDLYEIALRSIETQSGVAAIHIYLWCDGPLTAEQEAWLLQNGDRFFWIERSSKCWGLASALNALIERLGDEEFVFRMDGDDISHPGRFLAQISYLYAHPQIGLVGCQVQDIDDEGLPLGPRNYPEDPADVAQALTRLIPVLHPTFCIRRSVFNLTTARFPMAYLTEDLGFLVRLSKAGVGIANLSETLFSWRTGAGFYKRRSSIRRGLAEFRWYARAVYHQHGLLSLTYIYPLLRLIMRGLPQSLLRRIYQSRLRSKIIDTAHKKGRDVAHTDFTFPPPIGSILARCSILRVEKTRGPRQF